jgi:hypothetical protein
MTVTNRVVKSIKWELKGDNLFGGVKETTGIISGLLTPEHPEQGAFFSLNHKWEIYSSSGGQLDAIIQVFYQFNNNKQKPTIQQLFELTIDSVNEATKFVNNKLNESKVETVPRTAPPTRLDGHMVSTLESFILVAYPQN